MESKSYGNWMWSLEVLSLYIPFRSFRNLENGIYGFGSIVVLTLGAELRSVGCGVLN